MGRYLDLADEALSTQSNSDLADPAVLEDFAHPLARHVLPQKPETAARQAPSTVRCSDCAHFQPDTVGDGSGIGRCAIDAWPSGRRPVLYPRASRRCPTFEPVEALAGDSRRLDTGRYPPGSHAPAAAALEP